MEQLDARARLSRIGWFGTRRVAVRRKCDVARQRPRGRRQRAYRPARAVASRARPDIASHLRADTDAGNNLPGSDFNPARVGG